jgi:hypothetical protein
LFFGSAPDLEGHLAAIDKRAESGVRVVVLRLKRVRNPDAVCLGILEAFLSRLEARGVTVLLCAVRPDLAKVLRSTGLEARLAGRLFLEVPGPSSSTLEAVRHAYTLLGGRPVPDLPAPRRGRQPRGLVLHDLMRNTAASRECLSCSGRQLLGEAAVQLLGRQFNRAIIAG